MEEQVKVAEPEVKPQETPAQGETPQASATNKDDLIRRASQVKVEPKKTENEFGLSNEDWQKVQSDPTLQKYYKSMATDYDRKTQQLAELRRGYESKLAETKDNTWTPEKVQGLLQDQNFVKAAQAVASNQNDSGSMLSDAEKQRIQQAEQAAKAAQSQLMQLQQQQIHSKLKSKYANYDPTLVDTTLNQLLSGKVSNEELIESVWKARDYESMAERTYQLGVQDKVDLNKTRVIGMSQDSGYNMTQPERIEKNKGESTQDFLVRSYQEHAKKK